MVIGYLRCIAVGEISNQQRETLKRYGVEKIVIDSQTDSKELQKLCQTVQKGDTIVVYGLTSLKKTLKHLQQFFQELEQKRVCFISLQEHLEIKDYQHSEVIQILNLLAENEYLVKRDCALRVMDKRKQSGETLGRPKISIEQQEEIQALRQQRKSMRMIASKCGISLGTVQKYLSQMEEK